MKLDINKFAFAAANTIGILYIIYTGLCILWPKISLKMTGWLLHIVNIAEFTPYFKVTVQGSIFGIIQVYIYTFISVWIFAWLYNNSLSK